MLTAPPPGQRLHPGRRLDARASQRLGARRRWPTWSRYRHRADRLDTLLDVLVRPATDGGRGQGPHLAGGAGARLEQRATRRRLRPARLSPTRTWFSKKTTPEPNPTCPPRPPRRLDLGPSHDTEHEHAAGQAHLVTDDRPTLGNRAMTFHDPDGNPINCSPETHTRTSSNPPPPRSIPVSTATAQTTPTAGAERADRKHASPHVRQALRKPTSAPFDARKPTCPRPSPATTPTTTTAGALVPVPPVNHGQDRAAADDQGTNPIIATRRQAALLDGPPRIRHRGRRSGKAYLTPQPGWPATPSDRLTFGNQSDWSRNVRAARRMHHPDRRATSIKPTLPQFINRADAGPALRTAFNPPSAPCPDPPASNSSYDCKKPSPPTQAMREKLTMHHISSGPGARVNTHEVYRGPRV